MLTLLAWGVTQLALVPSFAFVPDSQPISATTYQPLEPLNATNPVCDVSGTEENLAKLKYELLESVVLRLP